MELLRILMIAATCLAVGCSLPPAVVLSQASPNPLIGEKKFAILPAAFVSPLHVGDKTEDGYLAGKSADDTKDWDEAKDAFNSKFTEALVSQGLWDPSATFTVRPTVKFIEPGFYVGVASAPAEVDVEVAIVDGRGKEIDRIAMRPKGAGLSVRLRLASCGLIAGAMTAEYMRGRTLVPQPLPEAVPAPLSSATSPPPSVPGCARDTDCKGDRVCEKGVCASPIPSLGKPAKKR